MGEIFFSIMIDQLRSIDAMVFGHTAYRELARYWQDGPTETAVDREQTAPMNSVTKLVLSRGALIGARPFAESGAVQLRYRPVR